MMYENRLKVGNGINESKLEIELDHSCFSETHQIGNIGINADFSMKIIFVVSFCYVRSSKCPIRWRKFRLKVRDFIWFC